MTRFLRRAGHGRLPDGRVVAWSVAEGARGRRWRWTLATGEGTLAHVGLVELDPDGRLVRLELESGVGMLTLHPDADGSSAHGNVVRADRVDAIAIGWTVGSGVLIAGDAFASAFLSAVGTTVVIEADLTLDTVRSPEATPNATAARELDARGIPRLLAAVEWPLEI